MIDLVKIRRLERLGPYRLKLWFTDGQAGEWDFSDLARDQGPMVEPFKDPPEDVIQRLFGYWRSYMEPNRR